LECIVLNNCYRCGSMHKASNENAPKRCMGGIMKKSLIGALALSTMLTPVAAMAETEVQFWHAFTGRLGELVKVQVADFNASQSDYTVIESHKGNYSETLNAGIAAFRAGEQPQILMVFEVGTATMMAAGGAVRPMHEVMAQSGATFNPDSYIGSVKGYYTTTEGDMLSLPFNASTPVLWVNRDAMTAAGVDPDTDLSTWQKVDETLDALKAGGEECPLVTAWQSWIHLENFSAYHDVPFASKDNGFAGVDTELMLNGEAQVAHLTAMGQWAKDGKFIYTGRRNEGGANFRAGDCALFTESSAGYAGISSEAEFEFDVRPLPYWEGVGNSPQNTIIGGASLWVMEGHEDAEYNGAGEFLSYLSSSDVQAAWHQNTGYLPITSEAGEATRAAGFYDENPGTDIAVIQMTAKEPTANSKGLRLGSFDQIRGIIDEELEGIWSGDKTAQEAMDSAKERGDALLRRFEQANG
jgi:sn-glycerol 3-phosphate transport system substrate-binding protein